MTVYNSIRKKYMQIKVKNGFFLRGILFVIFFQISLFSLGQQNEDLLSYANDIKIFDAENAVQICENILRRTHNRNCDVYEVLVEANFILESYDKAIEYIYKIKSEKCSFSSEQHFKLLLLEAEIYHILELGVYETHTLEKSKSIIDQTSDVTLKNNLQQELEWYQERMQVQNHKADFQTVKSFNIENKDNVNELTYLKSLKIYGLKSFKENDTLDFKEIFVKTFPRLEENFKKIYFQNFSLIEARYYFDQKEYLKAIDILNNTLNELNSQNSHYYYKRKIIDELVKNYIEIREEDSLLEVRKIGEEVEQKIQNIEISIINKIIKNTKDQNDEEISRITQNNKNTLYILLLFSTLLILISILVWFRYYWQERQYSEIEKYLNQLSKKTEKKESKTKSVTKISNEIESKITNGLEEFEKKEEFLYNNVSLAYLASKLEVNTRYLSSFLNSQLNESFSSYINRLRVEYIVGKLKSNPKYLKYKISYLAEESGYTSHSSFTIAFKAVTGMSPTKFINYLKK